MAVKRSYTKLRRAEAEERTRRRIVEALVELHEEIGPARTTISAVAERAGVERLTVYRHFPDETAMFTACSSLWAEMNPAPPLPSPDTSAPLPAARRAILLLYQWFRENQKMLASISADAEHLPSIRPMMEPLLGYLAAYADGLESLWSRRNRQRGATLRHAVEFTTWRSLAGIVDGDRKAVEVVLGWLKRT
ncbi:MAG: helix-turn-helix domain-containing protein [Thermoanaerobaculia bacterium]